MRLMRRSLLAALTQLVRLQIGDRNRRLLAALTQLTSLHGDKTPFGPEGAKALAALTLGLEIY